MAEQCVGFGESESEAWDLLSKKGLLILGFMV